MTTAITLQGETPVHVQNVYGVGFTIQNNGPGNAYFGDDTSISPSTGLVVQPGVQQPVSAGTDLWACTDVGQAASIVALAGVTGNGATIVEINGPVDIGEVTLAPGSTVGIDGTVDVTGNVGISGNVNLAPGSEVEISGPIAIAGPVDVSGSNVGITGTVSSTITGTVDTAIVSGTVDIGTISGPVAISSGNVDIVNQPLVSPQNTSHTYILNGPFTVPSGGNVAIATLATIGLYQTLNIYIVGNSGTFTPGAFYLITIAWQGVAGTLTYTQYQQWCNGISTVHIPIRGDIAQITIFQIGVAFAGSVNVSITATTATIPPYYASIPIGTIAAGIPVTIGIDGILYDTGAATAGSTPIPSVAGQASVHAYATAASGAFELLATTFQGGTLFVSFIETPEQHFTENVNLPWLPLTARSQIASGTVVYSLMFSQPLPGNMGY